MPYITPNERKKFEPLLEKVDDELVNVGQLAYCCYRLAVGMKTEATWSHLSDIHKALIAAEREFYRKHLAPYEDAKITINGDVIVGEL